MKTVDTTTVLGGIATLTTAAATLFGLALRPTRDAIEQQNKTIEDLRKENAALKKQLADREKVIADFNERILKLSVEREKVENRAKNLAEDLADMTALKETKQLEILRLRQKLGEQTK